MYPDFTKDSRQANQLFQTLPCQFQSIDIIDTGGCSAFRPPKNNANRGNFSMDITGLR